MPTFTDMTGLASLAVAGAAAIALLPGIKRYSMTGLATLQGTVFVLMLIPIGSLPLAAYVRGATGDLSITTQVLLWCVLLRPWCKCEVANARSRHALLMLIALAALVLYPMALGAGSFDPYRLGYGDPLFVSALLLVAMAAWFWKLLLIGLCIAFATLAWTIGWYESGNLWDYLFDPFVAIYALVAIMIHAVKTLSQPTIRG